MSCLWRRTKNGELLHSNHSSVFMKERCLITKLLFNEEESDPFGKQKKKKDATCHKTQLMTRSRPSSVLMTSAADFSARETEQRTSGKPLFIE
ncbi:hypothetical protein CEXT_760111 [Caerostris extrusa]|uniref:Ycf15 n=1 Tax=Caerostris extrusa TaxID=172846 RepID=A0AAV4N0E0_CAEEX|nr:hypothetical protein CEXT_760111 [Caerostris extrusa]